MQQKGFHAYAVLGRSLHHMTLFSILDAGPARFFWRASFLFLVLGIKLGFRRQKNWPGLGIGPSWNKQKGPGYIVCRKMISPVDCRPPSREMDGVAPRGQARYFPPNPYGKSVSQGFTCLRKLAWSLPVYFFLILKRASKSYSLFAPPAALFVWISSALLGDTAAVVSGAAQLDAVVDSVENSFITLHT